MLILLTVSAIIAFYFYVKKCKNYWRERGIVSVNSNFFFGFSLDILTGRRSLGQAYENVCKAKPNEPYFGSYLMLKPVLFVQDPELIDNILVKDCNYFEHRMKVPIQSGQFNYSIDLLGGEEWKAARNSLSPAFTPSKIGKMYNSIEKYAEMLVERHFR